MTSIQGQKAMAEERMVVGAPATIAEEAYPGQDDTADNGAVAGKRERRVGKYRTKKGRRGVDSDSAESGAQPGTAFAAYLEVQADQEQRARAHWMEVTVQTYATGEIVHRALYNPTLTVHALKLVLQEALEFAPPVIDKDSGFEIPLRPGQVLRVGDIMHLGVPPEKRESFVTECGDELDLDTCWWMSPLGHAAHMKIMLKKSTHKVINFGRVGRSHRAAPSSKAAAPATNSTTAEVRPHHDHENDDGSFAEGSLGPGESLSSQSTTFLEPSRTSGGGAKKSHLTSLTSPSRRRGNMKASLSSPAAAPSPAKEKATKLPASSAHQEVAAASDEPQSPMSPAMSAPVVKYHAGAEFNAAAVEKTRKRILFYLERWEVDDDYSHALAFAKHALANHRRFKKKCRGEVKDGGGKGRGDEADDDDDEDDGEGDATLEALSLTLPPLQPQQPQQPRLASWKRSEWSREAMNGSWSASSGASNLSRSLSRSLVSSSSINDSSRKPKTAGPQQHEAHEAAQRKRDKRRAREWNEQRQSRLYGDVQSWEGARWVEQRLEKINMARCVPPLRGKFGEYPPLACLTSLHRLNLASNCLSGPLPALSLARLHALQQLNLEGNQLSGELPAPLTHLTALTELNLSKNHFTGPVPSAWGRGWHLNLGVLNLSHNRLDGPLPDELGGLRKLRVLNLSRNCFTGWLHSWVGRLGANLQQLTLNHNKFTGSLPEALGRLHRLEYFHVQHNRFEGLLTASMFAAMSPSLREVHLQSNQFFAELTATTVSDDPDELTRAEKLLDIKCEIEDMFEHCSVLA